jgi:serine phosphatase RsbU (regulator of sigma subunit)
LQSETLTFVSDGVLEARTGTGELFRFDRTAAISHYLPARRTYDGLSAVPG